VQDKINATECPGTLPIPENMGIQKRAGQEAAGKRNLKDSFCYLSLRRERAKGREKRGARPPENVPENRTYLAKEKEGKEINSPVQAECLS